MKQAKIKQGQVCLKESISQKSWILKIVTEIKKNSIEKTFYPQNTNLKYKKKLHISKKEYLELMIEKYFQT